MNRLDLFPRNEEGSIEDISIYTLETEKPLKEIFKAIHDKENGGETISHKDTDSTLISYLLEILPNYDQERVYISDIKKIFQWYNLLHKSGNLKLAEVIEEDASVDETVQESKAKKKEETTPKEKKSTDAKKSSKVAAEVKTSSPKAKESKAKVVKDKA